MTTVKSDREAVKNNAEHVDLFSPSFPFLDISKNLKSVKVQLDVMKAQEEKDSKAKDLNLTSQIDDLTGELNNIIKNHESIEPAVVSHQGEVEDSEKSASDQLESSETEDIVPPPEVKVDEDIIAKQSSLESGELEATPQITNPKTVTLPSGMNEDGAASAVSSIQNSSSVHKAKVPVSFNSTTKEESKDEYVSLTPDDLPLRADGKMPELPNLDAIINFFDPFMTKLMDLAFTLKNDDTQFDMDEIDQLASFILEIVARINDNDDSNSTFLEIITQNTEAVVKIASQDIQDRSIALAVASSTWTGKKDHLFQAHSNQSSRVNNQQARTATVFGMTSNNGGASNSQNDKSSNHSSRKSNKKL